MSDETWEDFCAELAVSDALAAWRSHEWDAASRLCACGQFFEAVGRERNGHPEHRMKAALRAAESAGRDGDKQ